MLADVLPYLRCPLCRLELVELETAVRCPQGHSFDRAKQGYVFLTANPVRHGLTSCPHLWPYSSFGLWVRAGLYPVHWGCCCDGRTPVLSSVIGSDEVAGE